MLRGFVLAKKSLLFTPQSKFNFIARLSDFRPSEDLLKERYENRSNENIDKKRARLIYQSRKRGMLENGVILSAFADKYVNKFDEKQLDEYDRLINLPTNDWDIYYWATKTKPTPPEFESSVMQMLQEHLNEKVSQNCDNKDRPDKTNQERQYQDDDCKYSIIRKQDENEDEHHDKQKRNFNDNIPFPVVAGEYELDINPNIVDLTQIEKLFDNRVKKYKNRQTMVKMTEWRKQFFIKRIRRTIAAPISLTGLGDGQQPRSLYYPI